MKKNILIGVLTLLALPSSAQNWASLKTKLNAHADWQSADLVTLLDSTGVTVDENASGIFNIHQVIRVQTVSGARKMNVLKYDYDPLTAAAQFTNVTVWKADGTRRTIDLSTACDYAAPARAIYWGARQIMIGVGLLQPGDIVDYRITKRGFTYALLGNGQGSPAQGTMAANEGEERFIPPMRGNFYDIVPFWVDKPTVRKIYSLDAPIDKRMQYEFYQGECHSSVRSTADRQLLTFYTDDTTPFKQEPGSVALFDVAPKLFISSTPTWKDKSLWFHKVNEDYGSFKAYAPAQKKVNELTKGKKTDMEKIAALTHWVADNIRYSGLSMGKGEGYTLHNTQTNYTDRCGVCKDKAALLISMLRMAGFEAYPAMTMAGSRIESIPADHFNHCVAVVKLSDGSYMPLDPTWVPFIRELWSSAEQQQNYLPGIPEGSDLRLTPVSAPENHYLRINVNSHLSADGTLSGSYIVEAEGQTDGSLRRPFTTGWRSQWRQSVEQELLKISPEAKLLTVDWGKNPADYQAGPLRLKCTFTIPHYASMTTDGALLLKPISGSLYSGVRSYLRLDTSIKERHDGFKDACSRLVETHETLSLPKGRKLQSGTENISHHGDAASFTGNISAKGSTVTVNHKLSLGKRVYEATDWPDFRQAVLGAKDISDKILVVK